MGRLMAEAIYAGDAGFFRECSKCGQLKSYQCFCLSKNRIFGINVYCKQCASEKQKAYFVENRDAVIRTNKKWTEANPERVFARQQRFRLENPGYDVEWRKINLDHNRALARKRRRERWNISPKTRICNAISSAIRDQITGKVKNGRKSFDLLGYTHAELKADLESKFTEGMSWNNYGAGGWEIDHIIPQSVFNFEKPEDIDFRRCWGLSNLQPMWASDNRSKNNKLSSSFQPSLPIGI